MTTTDNRFRSLLPTFCEGLEEQARKYLEYIKQSFLDASDWCSGDQNLDKNKNSKDCVYDIPNGKRLYCKLDWSPLMFYCGKEHMDILSVSLDFHGDRV